jgi:hypothetical protein
MDGLEALEGKVVDSSDDLPAEACARVRSILDYWAARRRHGLIPNRADFDPMDLPRHLPGILLVGIEGLKPDGTGIYRYRVVGEDEVSNRGHNPTGKLLDEGFYAESLESALADYEAVRKSGRPLYAPVAFMDDKGRRILEDSVMLPFSADGVTVSQVLVYSERRPDPLMTSETRR